MADGDAYRQHGRKYWKTSVRKMFCGDPTFEGSAVWSIDKMMRDGNLRALAEVSRALLEAVRLHNAGIDSQVLLDIRLREISREHPDQDSQTAIEVARGLSMDAAFVSAVIGSSGDEARVAVGQQLLARVAVEICSAPDLVSALLSESGFDRHTLAQIRDQKARARAILCGSEAVRQRVQKCLTEEQSVTRTVHLSRPRVNIDQQALVNSPDAFGD